MALMFFLPGVPSINYGDEAGLQGYKDPFNRRCYPWGHEDTELLDYVKELGRIRKSIPNLKEGRTYFVINEENTDDDRLIGFTREGADTDYIFFINRSSEYAVLTDIPERLSRFRDFKRCIGEFDGNDLVVAPYGYSIIKAEFVS